MRSGEHSPPFVPDDLLMMQEADSQQPVKNLASELRRVPDVATCRPGTSANASDQSARVSPEMLVS